jgi:hypothetical protein
MGRRPYKQSGTEKVKKGSLRVPSHRYHKGSGQGIVTLPKIGDRYTGKWIDETTPSPDAEKKYQRLIGEWLSDGLQPLKTVKEREESQEELTVAELCAAYIRHADATYIKDGAPTTEPHQVRLALRPVIERYGTLNVEDFGPKCLRAVRAEYVAKGWVRYTINMAVRRIRQAFRWAVGREMIRPEVAFALTAVEGLKPGQAGVRESKPVVLPPDGWLEKVLPFVKEPGAIDAPTAIPHGHAWGRGPADDAAHDRPQEARRRPRSVGLFATSF